MQGRALTPQFLPVVNLASLSELSDPGRAILLGLRNGKAVLRDVGAVLRHTSGHNFGQPLPGHAVSAIAPAQTVVAGGAAVTLFIPIDFKRRQAHNHMVRPGHRPQSERARFITTNWKVLTLASSFRLTPEMFPLVESFNL
jgi:hypothetical protein